MHGERACPRLAVSHHRTGLSRTILLPSPLDIADGREIEPCRVDLGLHGLRHVFTSGAGSFASITIPALGLAVYRVPLSCRGTVPASAAGPTARHSCYAVHVPSQ